MLDGIAKANILVANEPWKARAVGLTFGFGLFLGHGLTSSSFDTLPRHLTKAGPLWFAVGYAHALRQVLSQSL
jgi:hypothetical protein